MTLKTTTRETLYVARAEVRFRLPRSRRRRRLQIGRHQRKRLRLRLRVKHTISHRARYNWLAELLQQLAHSLRESSRKKLPPQSRKALTRRSRNQRPEQATRRSGRTLGSTSYLQAAGTARCLFRPTKREQHTSKLIVCSARLAWSPLRSATRVMERPTKLSRTTDSVAPRR